MQMSFGAEGRLRLKNQSWFALPGQKPQDGQWQLRQKQWQTPGFSFGAGTIEAHLTRQKIDYLLAQVSRSAARLSLASL